MVAKWYCASIVATIIPIFEYTVWYIETWKRMENVVCNIQQRRYIKGVKTIPNVVPLERDGAANAAEQRWRYMDRMENGRELEADGKRQTERWRGRKHVARYTLITRIELACVCVYVRHVLCVSVSGKGGMFACIWPHLANGIFIPSENRWIQQSVHND